MAKPNSGSFDVGMHHTANDDKSNLPPHCHCKNPHSSAQRPINEYDSRGWLGEPEFSRGSQAVGMHHTANNIQRTGFPPPLYRKHAFLSRDDEPKRRSDTILGSGWGEENAKMGCRPWECFTRQTTSSALSFPPPLPKNRHSSRPRDDEQKRQIRFLGVAGASKTAERGRRPWECITRQTTCSDLSFPLPPPRNTHSSS